MYTKMHHLKMINMPTVWFWWKLAGNNNQLATAMVKATLKILLHVLTTVPALLNVTMTKISNLTENNCILY